MSYKSGLTICSFPQLLVPNFLMDEIRKSNSLIPKALTHSISLCVLILFGDDDKPLGRRDVSGRAAAW